MNAKNCVSLIVIVGLAIMMPVSGRAYTVDDEGGRTSWAYQPGQGPYYGRRPVVKTPMPSATTYNVSQPPVAASYVVEPVPNTIEPPNTPRPATKGTSLYQDARTVSSFDVGLQGSHYHYHERDLAVKLQGMKFGVTAGVTGAFDDQLFGKFDTRLAGGSLHYKGSGEADDNLSMVSEIRGVLGRDFLWRNIGWSPYAGLGYRYLRHYGQGYTTTGASGYKRYSHYFFAPVGIEKRIQFSDASRLSFLAEYDHLIYGRQKSFLSDASPLYPDLTNRQTKGYGIRAEAMYKKSGWGMGPYLNYWNINQSDSACSDGDGAAGFFVCGYEPHNHTVEYGFQFRYSFY